MCALLAVVYEIFIYFTLVKVVIIHNRNTFLEVKTLHSKPLNQSTKVWAVKYVNVPNKSMQNDPFLESYRL